MAILKAKARAKLPKADFGEPGKRAYPMPDKAHAADAKARATQAVNAGRMSRSTEAKIDAKANRKLGEKGDAPRQRKDADGDYDSGRRGARDGLGHGRGGMAVHPSARGANLDNDGSMHRERY